MTKTSHWVASALFLPLKMPQFSVLYLHAQHDHKAFVPAGHVLPEDRIFPGPAVDWPRSTTLLSISWPLFQIGLQSVHISISPPVCSQEQPAGPHLLWSPCRRAKIGDAVTLWARVSRLVSGYPERGRWGLSPVIQREDGSAQCSCGCVWPGTTTAIPADTLFSEDVVLLQTMISHLPLKGQFSLGKRIWHLLTTCTQGHFSPTKPGTRSAHRRWPSHKHP